MAILTCVPQKQRPHFAIVTDTCVCLLQKSVLLFQIDVSQR